MTGNDLVDLNQAASDSNWQRKGYLDKIYTLAEQKILIASKDQNETVWLLWSMKEAAYKIYSRQTGIRNYAPCSLQCFDLQPDAHKVNGKVKVADHLFYTESFISANYIHTIAALSMASLTEIKVKIYTYPDTLFDYRSTEPQCVSHHGKYLALVY
ncbi:4'-phosphopantetheinyl transferase family protein [Pedobacter insulae]|uniref:4'-phosphopantetheinyl transferase superfamily protein n=1 Tax=Pedobacter insulae TaxID=414048 RepID=A0A1I2ZZK3_9SPHI|nr:4'-phosphopantetheinyl transferase superfamily protein [Pedobacter insulae]SFH43095.1 4'-phosphopantetheinyl transferase superfamily protein [Pedobacter insulae]